jgi:hypothetical protein
VLMSNPPIETLCSLELVVLSRWHGDQLALLLPLLAGGVGRGLSISWTKSNPSPTLPCTREGSTA